MKLVLIFLLSMVLHTGHAQCETRKSEGSVSTHLSYTSKGTGYGLEIGQQGIGSSFSFFIGGESIQWREPKNEKKYSQFNMYGKLLYRFYQNPKGDMYLSAVAGPMLSGIDFGSLQGLRALYVSGRNTALSLEPLYYTIGGMHCNVRLHLLL